LIDEGGPSSVSISFRSIDASQAGATARNHQGADATDDPADRNGVMRDVIGEQVVSQLGIGPRRLDIRRVADNNQIKLLRASGTGMGSLPTHRFADLLDPTELWLEWANRCDLTQRHQMVGAKDGHSADTCTGQPNGHMRCHSIAASNPNHGLGPAAQDCICRPRRSVRDGQDVVFMFKALSSQMGDRAIGG
jgi:hypothetical protein